MTLLHILAQAGAAAATAAMPAAQQGVISYPVAFFAAQQPGNASEMLARIPGFTLDTGNSVRGFEGAAGNVLINGQRPTSKTDNLEEILRRIPASQVERIDVIRGGAPGVDMQGKSVLANVVRKSGQGFRGLFAVASNHIYDGRDMHGMRVELSGGEGERNWEASARYGYGADDGGDEGSQVRLGPNGEILRRSLVKSQGDGLQKTLTGAYETPLLGGKLRVNGRVFWDKFKFREDNRYILPASLGIEHTDEVDPRRDTEIGGRFNREFGARTSLEVIALRQTRDQQAIANFTAVNEAGRFALDRQSSETIGRAVLKYRFDDRLSLEAGGEGAFNVLESKTQLTDNGAPIALPAANVRVEETRGEGFVKAVWRPTEQWTMEAGVRQEGSSISSSGDVAVSKSLYFTKPRVAATWVPTAGTQLRVSFERVVGQLNFDDFVATSSFNTGAGVTAGNPNLNPEQAWVSEVAIEQRFWGGGIIVLTARHSALSDVIDRGPVFIGSDVFDRPTNIGDGTKDVLIANLTVPFDSIGLKGAQLKAEGTWRRSEVTDPTTHRKREISGLRPLEWSATFSHDLPQWRMSYGVDVYSGWRETYYRFNAIETTKLHNSYVRPFAEWRLQPDLVLRVELPNITERGMRRTRQVYAGPRSTSPILYADDRDLGFGRMFYVRVRKTF